MTTACIQACGAVFVVSDVTWRQNISFVHLGLHMILREEVHGENELQELPNI